MKINHINIEVTKICNQSCYYCFNNSGTFADKKILSYSKWLHHLKLLEKQGLRSVHLTGGEPFIYQDIIQLIDGCIKLRLSTSILSNGLRINSLTKKFPDTFSKLSLAQISLDSVNEQKHNRRRGNNNAFKDAVQALDSLYFLEIPLEISMTIDEDNLEDIDPILRFAEKYNAKVILRKLVKKGRTLSNISKHTQYMIEEFYPHDIVTNDRFHYVTDLPINAKPLIEKGVITVDPVGNIDSSYLNNFQICNISNLKAA